MSTPQTLLQISNAKKAYGTRHLFEHANFSVNEGEHIGVIGPNGAGKTTLFKVLTGQDTLDHGDVIRSQRLKLAYLSQHDVWQDDETGNDYLEKSCILPLWEVKSRGRELQISEAMFETPIKQLSGGQRMRIKLLNLLGQDPNLMLLDEPTNYLDLESTLLLERFLQNYEGAILLISHDREFLRRTTDHIVEVEAGEITKYNGNLDDYFEQKELLRSQLEQTAQNLADKRQAILDFVAKFGAKATKAKQAQSRLKNLERMEQIELKPIPNSANIKLPTPIQTGKLVMKVSDANLGHGDRTVISNVNIEINRGDHVAVVGLNGAGKSTLLKGLAGVLAPQSGTIHYGHQVSIAIYNQHVVEVLNPNDTVYESLQARAHHDVTHQEILSLAGSLLFSGDQVEKRIRLLSGGEKSRVALGQILLQKSPCILLDEPTNHLDFQTVDALAQALNNYDGTVIVVSHERSFVRRIGTKILEVANGKVSTYPGPYDDYVWSLQKRLATGSEEDLAPSKQTISAPISNKEDKNNNWAQRKERESKLRSLDKKITRCEEEIAKLEKANIELSDQIANQPEMAAGPIKQLEINGTLIRKFEDEWMQFVEERDALH